MDDTNRFLSEGDALWVSLSQAEFTVEDGWLALYRGRSMVSRVVQRVTHSSHSHVGMFWRSEMGLQVMELVEGVGGRVKPVKADVARLPGLIDVFGIRGVFEDAYDRKGAVHEMQKLIHLDYGWYGVWRLLMSRIPGLWNLVERRGDTSEEDMKQNPFCSHAVSAAVRNGGGIDPVPWKPDSMVTPGHLASSLLFDYRFTLVPDVDSSSQADPPGEVK